MFDFLDRWFGKDQRCTKSILEKEEVLRIAREAAKAYPNCEDLSIATFEERSNGSMWIVSSATVGHSLEVLIDDASGKVLEIQQLGVR